MVDKIVEGVLIVGMLVMICVVLFACVMLAQMAVQPSVIEIRMTAVAQCVSTERFTYEECVSLASGR